MSQEGLRLQIGPPKALWCHTSRWAWRGWALVASLGHFPSAIADVLVLPQRPQAPHRHSCSFHPCPTPGCCSIRTGHGRSALPHVLPFPPHHPAPNHLPFAQRAPPPSGCPPHFPGHRCQRHPQSCIPWPRWCVQVYLHSLLDSTTQLHSFCEWPGGRCSISWPCLAWGGCTLRCESALIRRINAHKLPYWWWWIEWPEPSEPSASPWMRTWQSPTNEGDLPTPLDPQRHRPVSPSPTTATPRRGVGRCPRRWSTCNKRLQTCTTNQARSGVFCRQSSWMLNDVVGARRAPKRTEVVHNHASDSQYMTRAKRFLDDCRRPRRLRHSSSRRLPWCSDHAIDGKTLPSTAWSGPRRPCILSRTCRYQVHIDHQGSRHVNSNAGWTSCRPISFATTTLASLELSSIVCRPFGQKPKCTRTSPSWRRANEAATLQSTCSMSRQWCVPESP